jgi:predicted acetyltransferase
LLHSETVELVEPGETLEATYCSFVDEFRKKGEPLIPAVLEYDAGDFGAMIRHLRDDAAGIGLPEGYVPASCFWLIDQYKNLVGVAHLRHALNATLTYEGGHIGYSVRPTERNKGYGKLMLKLVLGRAKALGITQALLTCDKTNVASAKVILGNGGRLDSEVLRNVGKGTTQRYWINTG